MISLKIIARIKYIDNKSYLLTVFLKYLFFSFSLALFLIECFKYVLYGKRDSGVKINITARYRIMNLQFIQLKHSHLVKFIALLVGVYFTLPDFQS